MNNEKLDEKAQAYIKQSQQFEGKINTLKSRQVEFDGNRDKINGQLRTQKSNTPEEQKNFEKLRESYNKANTTAENNRTTLKQTQAEYSAFKEQYAKSSKMKEAEGVQKSTVTDPNMKDSSEKKLDTKTAERIESTQQEQGNNHQNKPEEKKKGNLPNVSASKQRAQELAKNELAGKGITAEKPKSKDKDMLPDR